MSGANPKVPTQTELFSAGLELWHLAVEVNMVVSMRVMGLLGLWEVKSDETLRMFSEKGPSFADSAIAAQMSAMKGDRPDQIMVAAIRPLRMRTYANSRRLSRRGARALPKWRMTTL